MTSSPDIDQIAQEIRRVNGDHSLGAGALAEALMPFIARALLAAEKRGEDRERERCAKIADETADSADRQNATFTKPSLDFQRWAEGCRNVAAAIRSSGGGNGGAI